MTVTDQLLRVYRIDQQIQGLESRSRAAQRFLTAQQKQLDELNTKASSLESQHRQLTAKASGFEHDADAMQEKIDGYRDRMSAASTNKQYQALLVEVNTLKTDKAKNDEQALELMQQAETIKAELEAIATEVSEREAVCKVALTERDQRRDEIKDRLEELKSQRVGLIDQVDASAIAAYNARAERHSDEEDGVMAPVETHDFRRMEFTCGSCMMGMPIELVTGIMTGRLTTCTSCGVILFIPEELHEKLAAKSR